MGAFNGRSDSHLSLVFSASSSPFVRLAISAGA